MKIISISMAVALASLAQFASADEIKKSAAAAFAKGKENVVKLTVTRKVKERDKVLETTAVSFDGKGMLVTSLSGLETSSGIAGMLTQAMAQAPGSRRGSSGELVRVAMFQADGSEAEGDLVLTAPDLDLAFIKLRPAEEGADEVVIPAAPSLSTDSVGLLDQVLGISRLGASYQREASASLLEISAVITTPSSLLLPGSAALSGSGAFNLKGELIGIFSTIENKQMIVPIAAIQKLAATIK